MTTPPHDENEPWRDSGWQRRTALILDSYRHWLGRDLIDRAADPGADAKALFEAPFVVVAHDSSADPLLMYGNRTALRLWDMNLRTLMGTPSRLTAEPVAREARARMLAQANEKGYIDDYRGIRIASSGRRFEIERAVVWNLVDADGRPAGQAATFSTWRFLDGT